MAALVTYALKAGRRDQLRGILLGVIIAVLISIGLAILFGQLSASVQSGFGQELLEGITGLAAALMLIYVSNWILSKSQGKKWEEYLKSTAGEKTASGGIFALVFVSFLNVAREGRRNHPVLLPDCCRRENSQRLLVHHLWRCYGSGYSRHSFCFGMAIRGAPAAQAVL